MGSILPDLLAVGSVLRRLLTVGLFLSVLFLLSRRCRGEGERIGLALVLFLVTVPPITAQPVASGTVLGVHGEVLSGAQLELRALPSYFDRGLRLLRGEDEIPPVAIVQTDAAGRFSLRPAKPGIFEIEVHKAGFVSMRYSPLVLANPAELPAVRLVPSAGARVEVRDGQGKPLGGLWVWADSVVDHLPNRGDGKGGWRVASRLGRTDSQGLALLSRAPGELLMATVFNGTRVVAEGVRVEGTANLRITEGELSKRVLELVNEGGTPVSGALVEIGDHAWPVARTGDDGRTIFFTLREGPLRISVLTRDGAYSSQLLEAWAQGDEPLRVVLSSPWILTGYIVDSKTRRPLTAGVVWDERDPGAFQFVNQQGRFRLAVARRSAASVWAEAPGHLRWSRRVLSAAEPPTGFYLALTSAAVRRGWTVDAVGKPIMGVHLEARATNSGHSNSDPEDASGLLAVSGTNGSFLLAGLDPRRGYELVASKPGFAPARLLLKPNRALRRSDGAELRIALVRTARGQGKVVDSRDRPIVGAEVQVQVVEDDRSGADLGAVRTDGEGRFEISALPTSKFDLAIRKEGFVPRILRGLPSPASDVLVDLGRIALAEGGSFTGFVTDEEGKPLAGVSVWIAAGESPPSRALAFRLMHSRPAAVTGPTGIFELRDLASEESVQLWVARDGYVPVWRRGDLGQGEREPILIVLSPGLTVSGWVLDEDGKPVARAQVSLRDADHPIESADRGLGPGNLAETSTGAVGEFQIGDLEPGTVVVSVTAENYLPTEPQVLNLYQERTVKDLTFVLKRGSVLYGRVSHNGAPVAAAFVEVGKTVTRSLADGSYRLSGLSSGLALVNVRHPSYRPLRREIEIAPGSTNLDFTLETGLRLRGRVVFQEAGRPAEGANLRLVVQGYSEAKAYAKTAADGSFAMDGLIEGRYSLTAEKQGYFAPPILVDLMEDAEVEIELQLAGSIKGRILGLKDADLARVRVEAAQRRQAARSGVVWSSGEFAVEGLEPGAWTLRAWLPGGTRQTVATVDIATEDRQVHRDLEFVGLSLAGRVTYGGAPLIGATISLTGLTDLIQRAITTDDRGEFRIEDLPRNRYLFSLNERRQMVFYSREIQVDDDQRLDVEIPAAGLSGRVVSDSTGGPVTGVLVQLTPLVRAGNALATSLASVMTDANGLFAFPRLAAGSYHLIVQGPGFRPLDRTLELIAGKHEEGLVLALTPTGN